MSSSLRSEAEGWAVWLVSRCVDVSTTTANVEVVLDFVKGLWQPVTALALVGMAVCLSWAQNLQQEKEISWSVFRAFVQLLAVGYILEAIFNQERAVWIVAAISFMIVVAAHTAGQRAKRTPHSFLIALVSISVGTSITMSLLVLLGVFPFTAQFLIPTAGMMVGNSMTATGMTIDQIREQIRQGYAEIEVALSLGATPRQAVRNQVRRAFVVATGPLLDSAKTMGIVSLPGTMTGLILGGASPLEAVKLQIVVLNMLVGACTLSALLATYLTWPLFFTRAAQFRLGAFDTDNTLLSSSSFSSSSPPASSSSRNRPTASSPFPANMHKKGMRKDKNIRKERQGGG